MSKELEESPTVLELAKALKTFVLFEFDQKSSFDCLCISRALDIIEDELKALEIIKEKEVDIHNLLNSENCEEYNGFAHRLGYKGSLTQEEYDLLKEVLR